MTHQSGRTYRVAIGIGAATMLAATLTACGGDSTELPPPPSSPDAITEPAEDLSPAEQQAANDAQSHLEVFLNAYVEVFTSELPVGDEAEQLFSVVEQHADGLVPQELRREIVGAWGEGQVAEGALGWEHVETSAVDLDHTVNDESLQRVDLRLCVDASEWRLVDAASGESVSETGVRSHWSYAVAWHSNWGGLDLEGWRIVERVAEERPC